MAAFSKAADWMHNRGIGRLNVEGPLEANDDRTPMNGHDVRVVEGSSERILLPSDSADVVLTDPPYHDDVQYGELSLPLRAWAQLPTDDLVGEASVNPAAQQTNAHAEYRKLLTAIFSECNRVLRPTGHLIFSYANRDPRAWEDIVGALHDAGFRASGYAVLHSENETDVVKRHVRACDLDFIIDVVPAETADVRQWHPTSLPDGDEGDFLREVGVTFMRVGKLDDGDLAAMRDRLAGSRFLAGGQRNLVAIPIGPEASRHRG